MKQSEAVIAAVKFILAEIRRLSQLSRNNPSEEERWQFIYTIPSPHDNFGELICGLEALGKVDEISQTAINMAGLAGRVSCSELRKTTGLAIVKFVLEQSEKSQDVRVKELLKGIGKAAKALIEQGIFLFPCHLMTAKTPSSFDIGPVQFLNRKMFRKLSRKAIDSDARLKGNNKDQFGRGLIANSLRYYHKFQWVACVRVNGASNKMSLQIARSLADAAIDCLHLMFGGHHSRNMRLGSDAPGQGRIAQLQINDEGNFDGKLTFGSQGQSTILNGWWEEILADPMSARLLECHSMLIGLKELGVEKRPVAVRFLDACHWFGDAVRDASPAARIVKLTNGLERLLIAKETKDICETLSTRISAVCKLYFHEAITGSFLQRAREAYRVRCDLVHGSKSPTNLILTKAANDFEDLAQMSLQSALLHFHSEGIFGSSVTQKKFEAFLDELGRSNTSL